MADQPERGAPTKKEKHRRAILDRRSAVWDGVTFSSNVAYNF
jgi:hypothetical protein